MYKQCSTPFFIVSLSNCSEYFATALVFLLAMAAVFGFSPTVTQWYTSSVIRSFCCFSAIVSGGTHSKMETAFNILTISSLFSSSIFDWTAQMMFCASCLRSLGISVLLGHWSTTHRLMNIKSLPLHHYWSHSHSQCHMKIEWVTV